MPKPQFSKEEQRKIALTRIKKLFAEAELVFYKSKKLANRYVELASNISMKVKVRIPLEFRRKFCKYCHAYLVPGSNCRIRTRDGKVIISCLECKEFMRIPIR